MLPTTRFTKLNPQRIKLFRKQTPACMLSHISLLTLLINRKQLLCVSTTTLRYFLIWMLLYKKSINKVEKGLFWLTNLIDLYKTTQLFRPPYITLLEIYDYTKVLTKQHMDNFHTWDFFCDSKKQLPQWLYMTTYSYKTSTEIGNVFTKPKITTSLSIRFRKNYNISFLLKPTATRVYQTIWSCRVSCFYRLVSPTYSKVHLKKYKKFLDILSTKIFIGLKSCKPVTNLSIVTPDVLDIIPLKTFNKQLSQPQQYTQLENINFCSSGFVKLHRDFFRSLKIRRSLPRRIRRKVLSKKIGRLWLN